MKMENCTIIRESRRRHKEDIGPKFQEEERAATVEELKCNKAEEIDNIPAEMLISPEEGAMTKLLRTCQDLYTTGV